jgi:hypothetical protein
MIMSALLFEFCEMIDIEASSLGSKTTANVIQRASFQPSIYWKKGSYLAGNNLIPSLYFKFQLLRIVKLY